MWSDDKSVPLRVFGPSEGLFQKKAKSGPLLVPLLPFWSFFFKIVILIIFIMDIIQIFFLTLSYKSASNDKY